MKANFLFNAVFAGLFLLGGALFIFGACSQAANLSNQENQLSYALGLQLGKSVGAQHMNINTTLLMRGLNDGRLGQNPPVTAAQLEQATRIILIVVNPGIAGDETQVQSQHDLNPDAVLLLPKLVQDSKTWPERIDY